MGYVAGYVIAAGLLSWFVLCCEVWEERERAARQEEASEAETVR
ncbi:hypothetical protein PBI_KALPINE_61 [Mycobacterium phage Kalpine]|nr:hypothetical protein PBI_KALPINE_61 [Mycobacterium phage Kalpine]